MYAVYLSLLSGPPMWERPATAAPKTVLATEIGGSPSTGGRITPGVPLRGADCRRVAAHPPVEDRVRGVRVGPGGGGATMRRSVESGRAGLWSPGVEP